MQPLRKKQMQKKPMMLPFKKKKTFKKH